MTDLIEDIFQNGNDWHCLRTQKKKYPLAFLFFCQDILAGLHGWVIEDGLSPLINSEMKGDRFNVVAIGYTDFKSLTVFHYAATLSAAEGQAVMVSLLHSAN